MANEAREYYHNKKDRVFVRGITGHYNLREELARLRDWLTVFADFVRLFDRAVGLVPQLDPRELERSLMLLGRIPDSTILRLFDLLGGLPDQDVIDLVEALSRLSPTAARRATKLMSGVIRTVAR